MEHKINDQISIIQAEINEENNLSAVVLREKDNDGNQTFFCARDSDPYSLRGRDTVFILNTLEEFQDIKYNLVGEKLCEIHGLPFADEKKISLTTKALNLLRGLK